MFKKLAFFALFLAVAGLFAATSVNAQRLIKRTAIKSADTIYSADSLAPEADKGNLDQCHNGGFSNGISSPEDCTGSNWVNGNAHDGNSHYIEDGHIRYRIGFSEMTPGATYTITISYDRLEGTDHAIDYLTTYDARTPAAIDPNGWDSDYDVIPCDSADPICVAAPATTAIPLEGAMVPPHDSVEPGVFTMWGADFSCGTCGAQFVNPGDGTSAIRAVTITFKAGTTPNAVLAWSGHIASRADWGPEFTTAIGNRTGSPYHMRLESGIFGGQQDRSLKGSAVILLPPSAADASIAGRVVDGYGRAISGAKITLYDLSSGEIKYAYTNTLGYYKIEGLELGNLFLATAEARRFTFVNGSIQFSLDNNLSSLNFQASR